MTGPSMDWFQVPVWMAGEWTKQGDLTVSETELRTGQTNQNQGWTVDRMTVRWGTLADRAGNIWHALVLPSERDGESKGLHVKFLTSEHKVEQLNAQSMVTRTRYLITETDERTRQLANEFQQESLNHYTIMSDGELQNQSYNRMYDLSGKPYREGVLLSRFTKAGPFVPEKVRSGYDMEQSLNSYLYAHGLAQLMTQAPPPAERPETQAPASRAPVGLRAEEGTLKPAGKERDNGLPPPSPEPTGLPPRP